MKDATHDYFEKFMDAIIKCEEEDIESPYTDGETAAYYAYSESDYLQSSEFEAAKLPKLNGINNFVKTLRKADVETIVITDQTALLIPYLHKLVKYGCTIDGPCVVHRDVKDDSDSDIEGIRINL